MKARIGALLLGMSVCSALCAPQAQARVLQKGMSGQDVKAWQQFLIKQGFLAPPALGNFAERTLKATIAFQKAHGLQGLGIVGSKTLSAANRSGFRSSSNTGAATRSSGRRHYPPVRSIPNYSGQSDAMAGAFRAGQGSGSFSSPNYGRSGTSGSYGTGHW